MQLVLIKGNMLSRATYVPISESDIVTFVILAARLSQLELPVDFGRGIV
jgi:hypothetical protein